MMIKVVQNRSMGDSIKEWWESNVGMSLFKFPTSKKGKQEFRRTDFGSRLLAAEGEGGCEGEEG
jgi:hypothetical protein